MGADGGEDVATSNGEKIFVSVRVRPLNGKETRSNDFLDWECINDTTIVFKNCLGERSMYPNAYNFDTVFGCDCSTKQVYEEAAKQIALSVVSGINSSIFAYGQTSSGKTYTMAGITQYTIADIYDYIDTHKEREFVLKFSAMEIYNEAVKDLLILDPTPLRLLDDPERGTVVERLTEETLKDKSHLLELLAVCEAQRQIGETSLNETSSRSHQILRLTVESSARQYLGARNSSTLTASVNFVDLAGSERTSQTLSAGTRLKEGCHINRSLLTLGKVIRALSKGRTGHVPYRDSKLTRILQNSLGGNARTAIICTMSPAHGHLEQTRNTLLFASCAKEVSTNARVNVVMSDKALVKHLRKELSRLESELKNMSLVSSKGDVAAVLKEKELQIEKMDKELKELSRQRDLAQSKIDEILSSKVQNQVSRGQDDSPQFSKPREKISWLDDSTITSDTDDYQRLDMDLTISESFTYLDGHGSFDISNQHADDDLLGNFQDQLLTDDYSPNLLSNNTVDLIAPDDHCDWNESNEDSEDKRQVLTHESSPNLLTNTSVEVVARSTNEESEDKLRVLTDESSPHVISDNTIDHVALDLTQDQDGISKSNNEDFDNNHRVLVDESSPQDVDEIPRRTNEDSEDKLQVLTVESSLNASSDNTIDHVTVDLPQDQDEISKSINEDSDNKCQVPHDQDEISKSIDEDSDNKRQVPHDQDETSKSIDEDYDNKGQVSIDEFSQDSHDRDEPPRSTNEDYEDNWKEVRCIEVLDSKPVSNILKNSPINEVINKEDDEYAIIPCDKNKVNESHQTNAEYAELAKRIKELQRAVDNLISCYPLEHSPYSTESDIASSRGLSLSRSRSCKAILTCNASFANKYEETPFEGLEREYSIRHRRFCSSRRSSRRGFHSSIRNAIVNEMEHDVKMSNASDFSSTDGSLDKPEHHKEPSHDMDAEVMEVNETEMKDERTEKTARDDMRDSVSGALQSPPSWAEEFESQRRRIIELWDACYIPLVHRTYFYLLFKGDPSDKLYIEVEIRRLSYMKSKLSHGGKVIMDGHTLTTSSSKRALNEERDILSRQIYKRIPVKERETLFQKWGIPLNSKQRRMQLAHHVWTDTLDMNHVKESASLVAMLVGFVDNDEVPKEMFVGLSFSSRNFNKRSSSWKGGMSSLL